MKHSTFVIARNVIIEYHLLGLLIIISYLAIGFPLEIFRNVLPVLAASALCLAIVEFFLYGKRAVWNNTCSIIQNQKRQFSLALCPYLLLILILITAQFSVLHLPAVLFGKSIIATIGVGFYIAIGIVLEAEHGYIHCNLPAHVTANQKILSSKQKSAYFLSLLLVVDWIIFALLYFDHLSSPHYLQRVIQSFEELVCVSVLTTGLSLYLVYLYNRNFAHILEIQINALKQVEEGRFDVAIPVVSNDELGLLAGYHNAMIERLRDRERLHKTLEKSVGANIMNKLLTIDEETLKQGESYHVAILFCDLRGFTRMGESASAEEVILFLNDYFANVSSLISKHNGIINKFMGDAVLAIFGLDNDGNAVEDAVNAALAIVNNNMDLYMPNDMHPETGVGIDFGLVMGGTIGSDHRYEYTIIGDAVNKASRLEGLSKRLGYSIILSEEAYKLLCRELRENFRDLGIHKVRGRNEAVTVYGCCESQISELD